MSGEGSSSAGRASDSVKSQAQYLLRYECQVRLGIFLPVSTFSADTLSVSVQPPCAVACISICAHVKIPNMAAKPLFGHTEIVHTPLGVGSAAPAAASAVPYMGKETRISRKGQ